ncbi:hypothetical protein [Actinokineospora sp.]|uniref:hypothetical protein n=1 Tax=Actinokineospora sp. TaxID=1872133 RepID=UPI003D6B9E4A
MTSDTTHLAALFARMTGDEKHEWAAASTLDVLWVLYDRVLDVAPDRVDDPDRDRFLLSKGHGPMAFYAVLVIDNHSSDHGWPGGIAERFAVENWATATVDGRDHDAIHAALTADHPGRTLVVVADVQKG